tara:strand:- start:3195 stop:3779 length:585 start_codon:yes stop_codon:yes gene_type:complete
MMMQTKFKVLDNFIPPTYADILESLMLSNDTKWQFQEYMDYDKSGYPQYILGIYDDNKIGHNAIYYTLLGFMSYVIDGLLPGYEPVRIRAVKQNSMQKDIKFYIPHTDMTDNGGYSLIYYPTDMTGNTYLFKEQDLNDKVNINRLNHNWKPIDQVSPKKNRLIIFPSNQYHAGSPPIESTKRYLINFNFLPSSK